MNKVGKIEGWIKNDEEIEKEEWRDKTKEDKEMNKGKLKGN